MNENKLTLLPTIFISKKDRSQSLLEYLPIQGGYQEKKLNLFREEFLVLTDQKIIIAYSEVNACYDLVTDEIIPLDFSGMIFNALPSELQDLKSFSKFYLGDSGEVRVIAINNKNPEKFKLLEKVATIENNFTEITYFYPHWLLVRRDSQIVEIFYRVNADSPFESKFFEVVSTFCNIGNKIPTLFWTNGSYYEILMLGKGGSCRRERIGKIELTQIHDVLCLPAKVMVLFGKRLLDSENFTLVITSHGKYKNTQIIPLDYKAESNGKHSSLNLIHVDTKEKNSYFGLLGTEVLEIWCKKFGDIDYRLLTKIPNKDQITQILLFPPSFRIRKEVVDYLENLLPIPRDLISSALEFF
jgi:hypothetical protein